VEGANAQGLAVGEVVKEIGSGLNGKRRKLHRVLADPTAAVIVVEHRDRLARFGVEHLESALSVTGRRVVVLGSQESISDLVRDVTEVLTSMCVRLYGQRAAKNRVARAVAVATGEDAE
jgi:putative resolvase